LTDISIYVGEEFEKEILKIAEENEVRS